MCLALFLPGLRLSQKENVWSSSPTWEWGLTQETSQGNDCGSRSQEASCCTSKGALDVRGSSAIGECNDHGRLSIQVEHAPTSSCNPWEAEEAGAGPLPGMGPDSHQPFQPWNSAILRSHRFRVGRRSDGAHSDRREWLYSMIGGAGILCVDLREFWLTQRERVSCSLSMDIKSQRTGCSSCPSCCCSHPVTRREASGWGQSRHANEGRTGGIAEKEKGLLLPGACPTSELREIISLLIV